MLKGLGLSRLLAVTDMSVHTLAPIHPHTHTPRPKVGRKAATRLSIEHTNDQHSEDTF